MAGVARRIALLLQYQGGGFAGSQRQADRPSVQEALEEAVAALTGARTRCDFAGRTDAGVHALGQVAAFTSAANIPTARWVRGLNHFLSADVAVQAAREVPADFDPRRAALDRTYHYRVRLAAQRQPLWERAAWVLSGPFDSRCHAPCPSRPSKASMILRPLPGRTDGAGTVRTLQKACLRATVNGLEFRFQAPSFLPHQVRHVVGQVIAVGRGSAGPGIVEELLARPRAGAAGPVAPPQGLYLVRVRYELAALQGWETFAGWEENEDVRWTAD